MRIAIGDAVLQALRKARAPEAIGDLEIDEAWPRDGAVGHITIGLEPAEQGLGDITWLLARRFGQHHGGIGRDIAVRRVARRLGGDGGKVEVFGQLAGGLHGFQGRDDLADEVTIGVHARGIAHSSNFVTRPYS